MSKCCEILLLLVILLPAFEAELLAVAVVDDVAFASASIDRAASSNACFDIDGCDGDEDDNDVSSECDADDVVVVVDVAVRFTNDDVAYLHE